MADAPNAGGDKGSGAAAPAGGILSGQPAGDKPAGDGGKPAAPEWIGTLEPDVREAIGAKAYKSASDLARAYVSAEAKINAKGLIPPGKDAKPEDWEKWDGWNALGRPEAPDKYDLKGIDMEALGFEKPVVDRILQRAHKAGASQGVIRGIMEEYATFVRGLEDELKTGETKRRTDAETVLKKEWGDSYPAKVELANRALAAFGGAELVGFLKQAGLASHPLLVGAFARMGEAVGEDQMIGRNAGGAAPTSAQARASDEIKRMRAEQQKDSNHPLNNRSHPDHAAAHKRLQELYDVVNPGETGPA